MNSKKHLRRNWQQLDSAVTSTISRGIMRSLSGGATGWLFSRFFSRYTRSVRVWHWNVNWTCARLDGKKPGATQLSPICAHSRRRRRVEGTARAEKKDNYTATNHMTLHSVISGVCLTRKWPAERTLNNRKQHDYSAARHVLRQIYIYI